MNTSLSPGQRADLLISAMTLDQKIEQLAADAGKLEGVPGCPSGFRHIPGIPELDIPTFRITNGPVGLGGGDCRPQDPATALPDSMALAATFNAGTAHTYGDLMGREARTLGLDELEGPGMDMARVGQGGRNFEYLGEDPYLSGAMAASEIRGIQHNDVIAMAKHFVLNDQEANRHDVNVVIDNRTLHELYLLPFEMSVKDGHVGSIMCAYNKVNGTYNCENPLLTKVLRDEWGFGGYVQSDFFAMHSTAGSMQAGTDLEAPRPQWYAPDQIKSALADGSVSMAMIDQALKRRYVQMFKYGIFDRPVTHTPIDEQMARADGAVAQHIEEQGAVLLKNDRHTLPLRAGAIHSIALIGHNTFAGEAVTGGGGSSKVDPLYTVSPQKGLQDALSKLGSSATIHRVIVKDDNSNLAAAKAAAANADVAIVMAGVVTREGADRPGLSLPDGQDALISAVASANPNTVAVLKDGDPVLMPWIDKVPAVLEAWLPGQEDGDAVANLLFGLVNPSGKLPVTYPRNADQTPTSSPERYPGVTVDGKPTVHYSEGLEMGYRWYDANGVAPLFPFGYGLSYTSFDMSKLVVTPKVSDGSRPVKVRFFVTNTGKVAGTETPQVYLTLPSSTGEPPERLVAFTNVSLAPGQTKLVQLTIDPAATNHPMSTWNADAQAWHVPQGGYTVRVGDSSAHLPLQANVTVRKPGRTGS